MYQINHDLKEVQVKVTAGSRTLIEVHNVVQRLTKELQKKTKNPDAKYKLVFIL